MKLFPTLIACVIATASFAQVGISTGNNPPHPSSGLDVNFSDRGFLPPRMTTSERNAIASPAEGLQVFNTSTKCLEHYVNGIWQNIHCACAVPSISSTAPGSRCGSGSVQLSASSSHGTLSWYDVLSGGTALASGPVFNTPVISSTTTYYVEALEGACVASPRVAVVATVVPNPSVNAITGPTAVTVPSTIQLANTTPGGTWSSGSPLVASVNGSGLVTALSAGSAVISYAVTVSGCTTTVTHTVTVSPQDPCAAANGQIYGGNCWIPTNVGPGQPEVNCSVYCASLGKSCNSAVMQAISQSDATNIVQLFHPGAPMTSCGDAPAYQWSNNTGCFFVESGTCTHNDNVAGRQRYCVCTPWP